MLGRLEAAAIASQKAYENIPSDMHAVSDDNLGLFLQVGFGGREKEEVELVELNQSPKFPPRTQLGEDCVASRIRWQQYNF